MPETYVIKNSYAKHAAIPLAFFVLYFAIACLNFHFYLTNEYTPGGDGSRIYPYLKYMEKVPESFPFWQAHKHHGYPLLADVENHMPWSLILNTESPRFNSYLNLVFFILTTIFAFTCRGIARILGLSQVAAFAVGGITILCVPIARVFMHGTLTIFLDYVLTYISILLLMVSISKKNKYALYLIIPASFFLGWSLVTSGYYILIMLYVPALILLISLYWKYQEDILSSIKKSCYILFIVTLLLILFSMPLLLPVLDGIMLSNTFATETPTINIQQKDLYYFYFGLWPFILLSVLFSKGLLRKYSLLFLAMASLNFILIFFDFIHFEVFFNAWANTPILRNIRWQHPFRELSSTSAAFCAGIFIDSIRNLTNGNNKRLIHFVFIVLFCLLMLLVSYEQVQHDLPLFMVVITTIFIFMAIVGKRKNVILAFCVVIAILMAFNFNQSPFGNKLYTASNWQNFKEYKGDYYWHRGIYGRDKFTPYFPYGSFSMVFTSEYRTLLSLLYEQDINAQRPHWIVRVDNVDREEQNSKIARLMGNGKPNTRGDEIPFRLYDSWVIFDDENAIDIMRQADFSPDESIILSNKPHFTMQGDIPLQGKVELTGKTAETISLNVTTNKNSIILIPEIYHRNWYAKIDGKETPVLKAYATMRAVAIPPGKHDVFMRFFYWPFWWGLGIAFVSIFFSVLFLYRYKDCLYRILIPLSPNSIHSERRSITNV